MTPSKVNWPAASRAIPLILKRPLKETGKKKMSFATKLREEIRSVLIATLYFGSWILALMVIKWLVLAEYAIAFSGWSMALVGALVLAKVVLVLEHVSLGDWVRRQPAWVGVVLRTAFYTLGVALVLIMEKGFEGRHEAGGFGPAVQHLFQRADIYHVWANVICIAGALLGYNGIMVVRRHLGNRELFRIFLATLPDEPDERPVPRS